MSDAVVDAPVAPVSLGASRSLSELAMLRFRRNKAAMAGLVTIILIALFSFIGPFVVDKEPDQVFKTFETLPPSFSPRPDDASLRSTAEEVAGRIRGELKAFEVSGNGFTATLSSDRALDPRNTRYFDRTDVFQNTTVVNTLDGGKTLEIKGNVERNRFLFGTDTNGRDLLVRVMIGGRISLEIGLLASLVALFIGVTYGAVAGYLGGRVDNAMMRFVEICYSLPFVFLVLVLVAYFGSSFTLICLTIGAVEWLDMARIVRGQTLALKRREFVGAAEALGLTDAQIIRRHIIPNTIGPVIVFITLMVPKVILLESFLSFLGLGVQLPLTSWGSLISSAILDMQTAPWLLIFPAAFFVATLFALNFVGDGLRDALDPKDR